MLTARARIERCRGAPVRCPNVREYGRARQLPGVDAAQASRRVALHVSPSLRRAEFRPRPPPQPPISAEPWLSPQEPRVTPRQLRRATGGRRKRRLPIPLMMPTADGEPSPDVRLLPDTAARSGQASRRDEWDPRRIPVPTRALEVARVGRTEAVGRGSGGHARRSSTRMKYGAAARELVKALIGSHGGAREAVRQRRS